MAQNFGSVEFEGRQLALTQSAYLAVDPVTYQNPRAGEPCYLAAATDQEGNAYRVTWYPYADYSGDDEGDACDWENPDRIELIESNKD